MKNIKLGVILLLIGIVPSAWNGCAKTAFSSNDVEYKSCSASGANLYSCINPSPESLHEKNSNITVNAQSNVDILFVVDNSGSMAQEQIDIGNKISGFLDKIKNLNWQIALTTTDAALTTKVNGVARPWSDGQFRPFDSDTGSEFFMRAGQDSAASAQAKLSAAIAVGISGSGDERGIYNTYRAIERAAVPSANRDFFRANAKLAVVVISDEDECSTGSAQCTGTNPIKSIPNNLVSLISSSFNDNKVFSFSSIIYKPGDTTCTTGGSQGNSYAELSNLTGGVMGSVCATDFAAPLAALGNRVVSLVNSATLACPAVDLTGDGKADIQVVLADGSKFSTGYTVSGLNVTFDNPLPEGTHQLYYFCK